MPAVYRYTVEETREVEITAESPADAIAKAQPYLDGTTENGSFPEVVVTRLDATKRY